MKRASLMFAALALFAAPRPQEIPFGQHLIDGGAFETCVIGDINRDGRPDILSGENWYEGPAWTKHHFRSIEYFRNATEDLSDLLLDVNGDGYPDVISSSSHTNRLWWNENPGAKGGDWKEHSIEDGHSIEFAFLVDLDNDGKAREVLPQWGGHQMKDALAWFELRDGRFVKHVVSPRSYGHGIGVGDLNGDGRNDIITPLGWLEAPADPRTGDWTFHPEFDLVSVGYIYVLDVNGDVRPDLVTSMAHDYGVFWMENLGGGKWAKHIIDDTWSQGHALTMVDLNGDGRPDFVTGKRYMAHNGADPGEREPLGVYWYEYRSTKDGSVEWIKHIIDYGGRAGAGMQIGVADLDGDDDLDLAMGGKTGLFLFENLSTRKPAGVSRNTFESRCATCHGGDASGGELGPSLLAYVRYHTDAELTHVIRSGKIASGMPAFSLDSGELSRVMSDLRSLAGTNPAMATAGLTGQNRRLPSARVATAAARAGKLTLAEGRLLEGEILDESDFSAVVRSGDGQFHLLARDEDAWKEKPVEPKSNWTTYHGGVNGNRYSSLEQINTANVQNLTLRWMCPIPGAPRIEATPLVIDGVMYVTAWNETYALDATTGRRLWMFHLPRTDGLLSEAGRGANRGAAASGDRIFMVTDNAHLIALDRRNGQKLWDVEMGAVKEGYSATGAPLVVDGLVISGVAGGEEGARGFVGAYKIETGERAWRFYVIPKRGEKGSETWAGNAIEHGCGATWLTGSYDPALDLIYWQTGNPCPDFNGDERKGDNLYTASVLALSAKTGELKWHFQYTPHDLHDWDATEPLLLLDQPWRGTLRQLLVHADRNGFFFVLDRTTGELLLAEPFVKVNWATGYGKDGRPILTENYETTYAGTLTCPASSGGANWPASSWSPITKLFYVRASDWCAIYKKQADPLVENRWMGGVAPNQPGARNFIRALDINTGRKVWEYPFNGNGRGGLMATAGGLVLFGNSEGALVALDANSGRSLWHFPAGQNWQASPMTYMVGGRQYISLAGPTGMFAFALPD